MMNTKHVWPVFVEAYHAISRQYVPVMDKKAAEFQLAREEGWLLLPALTFDPETISAEKLRVRSPYTSARKFQSWLESLVDGGFLIPEPGQDLAYRLTPKGREAILAVLRAGYGCMESLRPLESDDLEDIATSLYRMVHACLDTPEPPGKWSITQARKIDPGEGAHVIVRIDQYLSDLAAYRDDCHLAAWRVYPLDGHAWELLTVLWREGTLNLEAHADLLARRGFEPEETQAALGDLKELDWVQVDEGVYKLTAEGKAVRQAAEEATDDFFYKPWSCLSEKDLQALQTGLCRLKDALSK